MSSLGRYLVGFALTLILALATNVAVHVLDGFDRAMVVDAALWLAFSIGVEACAWRR